MNSFIPLGIEEKDEKIIDSIIMEYLNVSASQLVEKTHKIGTAWYKVFSENGLKNVIPFELIKKMECNLQPC